MMINSTRQKRGEVAMTQQEYKDDDGVGEDIGLWCKKEMMMGLTKIGVKQYFT